MSLFEAAFAARQPLVDDAHRTAFRLFNGFTEGLPGVVVEVYGRTLLVHDHGNEEACRAAVEVARAQFPWLTSGLLKLRDGDPRSRNGQVIFGAFPDLPTSIEEDGVHYALALTMNRDASFYLDTRHLRRWAKDHLGGKKVLNTFAYTGSLSVAARAGGANVRSTDANAKFLAEAMRSYAKNGWPAQKRDFIAGDFFDVIARLKREQALFDCVFLDPPFFSSSRKGTIDLQSSMTPLLNKVRPLVGNEGRLVIVNNAVFVSGAELMAVIDASCASGYLSVEERIDIPRDCAGYIPAGERPVDPAPFNHSTKIVVLKATRKDERRA